MYKFVSFSFLRKNKEIKDFIFKNLQLFSCWNYCISCYLAISKHELIEISISLNVTFSKENYGLWRINPTVLASLNQSCRTIRNRYEFTGMEKMLLNTQWAPKSCWNSKYTNLITWEYFLHTVLFYCFISYDPTLPEIILSWALTLIHTHCLGLYGVSSPVS